VSRYQGEIDWPRVAKAGIKFAYVKITEGATWQDPRWRENVAGAKQAKIKVGGYHLWKALTSTNADQVRWFHRQGVAEWDLPPAMDVEHKEAKLLQPGESQYRVYDWLDLAGRVMGGQCVLYISPRGLGVMKHPARTVGLINAIYPATSGLWLCQYDGVKYDAKLLRRIKMPPMTFRQYTSSGRVPGIDGDVDLDWFNGDMADLRDYCKAWRYRPGAILPLP
jgi:lysozyme